MDEKDKSPEESKKKFSSTKSPLPTKTFISYIRIATVDQDNGKKLSNYYDSIKEKVSNVVSSEFSEHFESKQKGKIDIPLTEQFEDIGTPSDLKHRPGLQKMLQYVKETKADYVIVPSFSMLSRKIEELIKIVDTIEKSGSVLVSLLGREDRLNMFEMASSLTEEIEKIANGNEFQIEWPSCEICRKEIAPRDGCEIFNVYCNDRSYDRVKAGYEKLYAGSDTTDDVTCPSCNVGMGQYHHWGCNVEECPLCRAPIIDCNCDVYVLMKRDTPEI